MKYFAKLGFVFIVLAALTVSCGDTPSSKFLKEYEAFVISAEKSAQNNAASKLESLTQKEADFMKRAGQIAKSAEWSIEDAAKYTALSARWTAAEAKLSALKAKDETGKAAKKAGAALKDLGNTLTK